MIKVQNYVNGNFVSTEETIEDINPATGKIIANIPRSKPDDVQKAVLAADNAREYWSNLNLEDRRVWLEKIADALESRAEEIAKLESLDTGKPIKLARAVDASRSVANFRFFAEFSKDFVGEKFEMDDATNHVIYKPVGVAGLITPWNLPLYLFTWKIAPALVSGNTVVAKPSEITPSTAHLLVDICTKVGLPPGVLNIVHGKGSTAGDMLVKNIDIKAISFTGGTSTGKKIFKNASGSFKKLSLEMGGKNPAIIFEDCNYELMLETVVRSSFSNQGQICLCSSRILVESSIYEKFKSDFSLKVSELIVGDPLKLDTQFGAISSEQHFHKIYN